MAKSINCSDPPYGARNYILKCVFFVQTTLANRYIHRRELWVVSLKSSSSVDFGINKIFSKFSFFEELARFKVLREHVMLGIILFNCSNKDFFFIKIYSKLNFMLKMKEFCVSNRRKAIKKA